MSLPNRSRTLASSGKPHLPIRIGTGPLTSLPPGLLSRPLPSQILCTCYLSIQTRHASFLDRLFRRGKKDPKPVPAILDPSSPNFLRHRPPPVQQPTSKPGGLAPGSIIEDEDPTPDTLDTTSRTTTTGGQKRDPYVMAAALDPLPHSRMRWQRKMVIRDVQKRGRLSKTERIMQTERELLSKSQFFKTSIKKLYPLARQIAGKPLAEALVQMRFSKKKAALDIKQHLEYARDEAIVKRGMGLGQVIDQESGEAQKREEGWPRIVQDKTGKKRVVADPTQMYVDQAWVGRGSYSESPEFRARGKVNILRHPTTSITVVLKEEVTRIRLEEEREQKRKNKKVWVPLPDRPVTAQRQYPLW